jgi:hypothetical protein
MNGVVVLDGVTGVWKCRCIHGFNAAGPGLRPFLKRDGSRIICVDLNMMFAT